MRDRALLARTLLANCIVIPALGLLLVHIFPLNPDAHSSKLELLGLVAAARSFCKEFAAQHKVEIDFSHKDVSGNLPKEISLSLYRVLQEALQKAVKHSGVRLFTVEFHGGPGEIQMEVADRLACLSVQAITQALRYKEELHFSPILLLCAKANSNAVPLLNS